MKKNILTLALVASILFGIFACQVYDQSTNGVVYTAMPTSGVVEREDLVAKIEKVDTTTDLVKIAKDYSESYTGYLLNEDSGLFVGRTVAEIRVDILALWDLKYPAEWDFIRR